MPTVRRTLADIDRDRVADELRRRPASSDAEIARWATEGNDAWSEDDLARAVPVLPPLSAQAVQELRHRLGLEPWQFAATFGFTVEEIDDYESGRRTPSGAASALLRTIAAEPNVVARAVRPNVTQG